MIIRTFQLFYLQVRVGSVLVVLIGVCKVYGAEGFEEFIVNDASEVQFLTLSPMKVRHIFIWTCYIYIYIWIMWVTSYFMDLFLYEQYVKFKNALNDFNCFYLYLLHSCQYVNIQDDRISLT